MARAIDVRVAAAGELDLAAGILEEAIAWLNRRGLEAWEPGTFRDREGWGRRVLSEARASGDLYLGWNGGHAMATITLQWGDPLFWPGAANDAGYVHRLAVADAGHGLGVGAQILAWAERQARTRGCGYLRLDCLMTDRPLRRYYEAAGFQHRGDVEIRGRAFSLYEKVLAS